MNLRIKLLLMFAIGELLLLTFFGYIAYDTAKLTNINNETKLLSSVAPGLADHVSHNMMDNIGWSSVLLPDHSQNQELAIYLLVNDSEGKLTTKTNEPAINQVFSQINKNILHDLKSSHTGSAVVGDTTYAWSHVNIPHTDKGLTLVRQAHISHADVFFAEMGVPLVIAAVIMLWVASWAAMYVSMLIEKLDEQKNILKHRSLHDVLTGLPNRALLNDRLQQLVAMQDRLPMQFAICFIDLNRFKDVNDTLGHHVGDELLLEVSSRIKENLRKGDTVARLGGDEFALILRNVNGENAKSIAAKLLAEIENPVMAGGHKLFISGSMGIAMFPEHGKDVHTLLKNADVAMYAAKRSGTTLEFYAYTQEVFTQDKLALTQDLREAINHNELELHYQPKFDVLQQKITGVEALLRWKHPVNGYIPPLEFIPLAEHSGLIHKLSKWVINKAFEDSIQLNAYENDLTMAINLSALSIQDAKFETDLREALIAHKVDASKIILELTESAMFVNSANTSELLKRLTDMGFRISVDDFGTGYSTLTNLRRMPISELKIDRSFVDKIVTDAGDASIVDAMIGLGESLDIDVVAEGVETHEVLETLKDFGCSTIQGNLISKPIPLSEFVTWIEKRRKNHLKLVSN